RPLHWTRAELEADLEEAKRSGDPPVWNMDPDEFAPEYGKTYYFFEELFPAASCKRIRQKQGTFMYSMLYLNNPKNPELAEFNENDLRWFVFDDEGNLVLEHADGTHEVVPFAGLRRVCFWDPAMSEAEQKKNARNAMIVMFKDQKGRLFIPEAYAERKNPTLLFSKFTSPSPAPNRRDTVRSTHAFGRWLPTSKRTWYSVEREPLASRTSSTNSSPFQSLERWTSSTRQQLACLSSAL